MLDTETTEVILLGDTNCDISQKNVDLNDNLQLRNMKAHFNRIFDLCNLFGFHQLSRNAARETMKSSTLIDHIATTNKSNVVEAVVHKIDISDNYLIYCVRTF